MPPYLLHIVGELDGCRIRYAADSPGDEAAEFVRAAVAALRDACGLNYRP
jgi:hypothetical protein